MYLENKTWQQKKKKMIKRNFFQISLATWIQGNCYYCCYCSYHRISFVYDHVQYACFTWHISKIFGTKYKFTGCTISVILVNVSWQWDRVARNCLLCSFVVWCSFDEIPSPFFLLREKPRKTLHSRFSFNSFMLEIKKKASGDVL